MKIRAILLTALVGLQLVCLAQQFCHSAAELAAAPHVVMDAELSRNRKVVTQEPVSFRESNWQVAYYMDHYSKNALETARKNGHSLKLSLEVALREDQPPMATQLFVNGVPIEEAVPLMYRGEAVGRTKDKNDE